MHELGLLDEFLKLPHQHTGRISVDLGRIFQMHDSFTF